MSRKFRYLSGFGCHWGLVILCAAALSAVTGCDRQASASNANSPRRSSRPTAVPAQLEKMPAGFVAIVHLPSPASFCSNWFNDVVDGGSSRVTERLTRVLAGPIGRGADFFAGLEAPTTVGIYGDPKSDTVPRVVIRIDGGDATRLNTWVEWLFGSDKGEPMNFGKSIVRRGGPSGHWYVGEFEGGWLLSNDSELSRQTAELSGKIELPASVTACWKSVVGDRVCAFAAVDVRRFPSNIQQKEFLHKLGFDRVDSMAISVHQVEEGRFKESLFVHSAGPHRGILGFLDGERIDAKVAEQVPASAQGFSFLSLNLFGVFNGVREMLPPQGAAQLQAIEQGMGFSVGEDFLKSMGSQFSSYYFGTQPEGGPLPSSVTEIALDDEQKFRDVFQKLTNAGPMPMTWSTAPTGEVLLAPPGSGPDAPMIAIGNGKLSVASSTPVMNDWLSGTIARGGHGSAAAFLARYDGRATFLGWFKSSAVEDQVEFLGQMGHGLPTPPMGPLRQWSSSLQGVPWKEFVSAFGDSSFVILPTQDGIEFAQESDCGLLSLGLFFGASRCGAVREERELKDRLKFLRRDLDRAQDSFRTVHGRFATNLWELRNADCLDAERATGIRPDFLYRIQANGNAWEMEIRKESDGMRYRVTENCELLPISGAGPAAGSTTNTEAGAR